MIIGLTQGKQAIIDDEDLDLIAPYHWRYGFGGQGGEYAVTGGSNGKPSIRMHRLIVGAKEGQEVDHINRNGLDNRKSNLRFVTRQQNNRNKGLYKSNALGVQGVSLTKTGKYHARIYINKRAKRLGTFDTLEEAVAAHKKALEELESSLYDMKK